MSSPSLVVPVAVEAAHAWAQGLLTDRDLIFHFPGDGAFLFASLPDRRAWLSGVRQMLHLWRKGARTAILRTGTPEVIEHIRLKCKARHTFTEAPELGGKLRFIIAPHNVDAYLRRLA